MSKVRVVAKKYVLGVFDKFGLIPDCAYNILLKGGDTCPAY